MSGTVGRGCWQGMPEHNLRAGITGLDRTEHGTEVRLIICVFSS